MERFLSKHKIKLPHNAKMVYSKNKNILTIIGPLKKKSIKVLFKLIFLKQERSIYISQDTVKYLPTNNKRKFKKSLHNTVYSEIKQCIIETCFISQKKLKLVGVGYKITPITTKKKQVVLEMKLGYSHLIFFKATLNKIKVECKKKNNLYIFGDSYLFTSHVAALIRSFKKPEPYKGKGFSYLNETIILKEGKKV